MGENIFAHIESIEARMAVHQFQLKKSQAELTTAKRDKTKAKIQHQIDYSTRQIAMIQKEWIQEDKLLRQQHPELYNMSDDELLKELGIDL